MSDESPNAPQPRGSYAKGVARRQEILDRAIEVFAQRGSDRTSMRAIARAVGVTHAALAHYFGSLEELLVEVYRESERQGGARRPADLVATALEEGHPAAREFATTRFARLREELAERVRQNQAAGRVLADLDPDSI